MKKRRERWMVALLLLGSLVSGLSKLQAAGEGKKAPDALSTARAFLSFAFTGQAKAAADLGEPGKSYSREEKIKKAFERLDTKMPPAIVRFLADEEHALAITEMVVELRKNGQKRQEGPLSIRLVKKDKRWLIRDIDMGNKSAAKNLERFQREHPKAKVVIPKKDK